MHKNLLGFTLIFLFAIVLILPAAAFAGRRGGPGLSSRVAALEALVAQQATLITQLQTGLTAEKSARIVADSGLQANINSEAAARASADTLIQADVSTNAGKISTNASAIAAIGPHTVDTTRSDAEILGVVSGAGYVTGPHAVDTTLDQAGVEALGFVTGPHTDVATGNLALAVSETTQKVTGLVNLAQIALNDNRARLSEVHATTTAGALSVEADAIQAKEAIIVMKSEVRGLRSQLLRSQFDATSLSNTAVNAEAVAAADDLNAWTLEVVDHLDEMVVRLDIALERTFLAEESGLPVPVGEYLGDAVGRNLEVLETNLRGDRLQAARRSLMRHIGDINDLQVQNEEVDAELANEDLNRMREKQQQTLDMMTELSRMLHETSIGVIRKIQ